MRTRVLIVCFIVAGVSFAGCSSEELGTSTKLRGIITSQPATASPQDSEKRLIFMSYHHATQEHLQEVLSGVETDEIWYLIELDKELVEMPTSKARTQYDLAEDKGIKLTFRAPFNNPGPTSERAYFTFSYDSTGEGVSGTMEITGSELVTIAKGLDDTNTNWGVGFKFEYLGPRTIFGYTATEAHVTMLVGALVQNLEGKQ